MNDETLDSVVTQLNALAGDGVTYRVFDDFRGVFVSGVITGNGSAQSTAHGLGVTPSMVLVSIVGQPLLFLGGDVTAGTHTSTNCVVTAPSGIKYQILAIR